MKFSEVYQPGRFAVSFELFPPKTAEGETALFSHLETLMQFEPAFVTCTYGAGGSTRDKTLDIVERVHQRWGVSVAAHLTCVGCTTDELRDYLRDAQSRQVENIVALRGDPPRGDTAFRPVPGGLRYANELVALIRAEFPGFGVAVAGYPEKHQEAPSMEVDLQNLKRKVDAGADIVITQLFYDNRDFFRFRDQCAALGIEVPIVPGVLPITSFAQVRRITSLCGARLPEELVEQLSQREDDAAAQAEVGIEHAVRQVQELIDEGVPGVHFYVLNKSEATSAVLRSVGRAV